MINEICNSRIPTTTFFPSVFFFPTTCFPHHTSSGSLVLKERLCPHDDAPQRLSITANCLSLTGLCLRYVGSVSFFISIRRIHSLAVNTDWVRRLCLSFYSIYNKKKGVDTLFFTHLIIRYSTQLPREGRLIGSSFRIGSFWHIQRHTCSRCLIVSKTIDPSSCTFRSLCFK